MTTRPTSFEFTKLATPNNHPQPLQRSDPMPESLDAPPLLSTARLRLRKPELKDADPIFVACVTDPDVVRFLTWQAHQRVQDSEGFIQRCLEAWSEGTAFTYVIELQDSPDNPIGVIDARPQGPWVAFGYVLARSSWGRGYMTVALSSLVDWSLGLVPK